MSNPIPDDPAPAQPQDEFVYLVSHDLRAPLRGISNLAQWIEEDLAGSASAQVAEHLRLLRGRVARLESMIDGLLQYSRAGRKREADPIDLNRLMGEIVAAQPRPPGFAIEVQPGLPTILGPADQVRQLFAHLIDNAVRHHHREDGRVRIECHDRDCLWEFAVADDGPGIPERFRDKVFVIFQTLESRDRKECAGAGLTIVKKIVEGQGGSVTLASQEGFGSTFRVLWPKADMLVEGERA